jgi:hypothetical protein
MGTKCSTHGGKEECIQSFGGKARKKESLERPRHRWEDNTETILREIGCG